MLVLKQHVNAKQTKKNSMTALRDTFISLRLEKPQRPNLLLVLKRFLKLHISIQRSSEINGNLLLLS